MARQLKKSTGSKMDTPRLMVQLKGLFDYIGNNDDVTFSSVMDQAKEIAHELLDSTRNTRCVTSTPRRFWTHCGYGNHAVR